MHTSSIYSLGNAQLRAVFASDFTNQQRKYFFEPTFKFATTTENRVLAIRKKLLEIWCNNGLSVVVLMSVGSVLAIKVLKCVTRVVTNNRN